MSETLVPFRAKIRLNRVGRIVPTVVFAKNRIDAIALVSELFNIDPAAEDANRLVGAVERADVDEA